MTAATTAAMAAETATAVTRVGAGPSLRAILAATRPKQWVKNLLVFAAPLAGGVVTRPAVAAGAGVALAAFTLAAAGGYLLNDVGDATRDRAHPDKQHRPVASGALAEPLAIAAGLILVVTAQGLACATDRPRLSVVLLVYSALTAVYGLGLKHVRGVELGLLSTGFVLRPLAGAVATGVPPSPWFLAVCCLAALTIVAGKRQVELLRLGRMAVAHRASLRGYTVTGLRRFRTVALVCMLTAYAGWALTRPTLLECLFGLASVVPVVAAMTRLGALNDAAVGDAPEAVLLHDRVVQMAVVAWTLMFVLGVGRV